MINYIWAENLPTFSFISLNPHLDPEPAGGCHCFAMERAVRNPKHRRSTSDWFFSHCPALHFAKERVSRLMAALYRDVGAPAAQRLPQLNTSAFNTMPETGGQSTGLQPEQNPESGHTLHLEYLMGKEEMICWSKTKAWGNYIMSLSALLFTVFLKRLNLGLKWRILWLMTWLVKPRHLSL